MACNWLVWCFLLLHTVCGATGRIAFVLLGFPKEHRASDPSSPVIDNAVHLEALRARVLDRYRRDGHRVDVILCNHIQAPWALIGQAMLRRLEPYTQLHTEEIKSTDGLGQFWRLSSCFRALREHHNGSLPYEWYIKSRPDLLLFDDAPNLDSLDRASIHARLLIASNFPNLVAEHFGASPPTTEGARESAWSWGRGECSPALCGAGPCAAADAICAVFDDQLFIAHSSVAHIAFAGLDRLNHTSPNGRECEWPTGGFPEHEFTRAVYRNGGRFQPLRLAARLSGYKGEVVPDPATAGQHMDCYAYTSWPPSRDEARPPNGTVPSLQIGGV